MEDQPCSILPLPLRMKKYLGSSTDLNSSDFMATFLYPFQKSYSKSSPGQVESIHISSKWNIIFFLMDKNVPYYFFKYLFVQITSSQSFEISFHDNGWVWISNFHISYTTCISWAMDSLSERMSPRFLVPKTFLRVVAASSLDRSLKGLLDLEGMLPGRPAVVVHVSHGADWVLHLIRKQYIFSESHQQYLPCCT